MTTSWRLKFDAIFHILHFETGHLNIIALFAKHYMSALGAYRTFRYYERDDIFEYRWVPFVIDKLVCMRIAHAHM